MPKYLLSGIGVIAFVIGGLMAREKTIEGIETLERTIKSKTNPPPPPAE